MRAVGTAMITLLAAGCGRALPVDPGRRCASESDCATVHPPGISDPGSPDFHGTLFRGLGWRFDACTDCHGDDFAGVRSAVSCRTCHTDGPTACTVCHAQPPATGAHVAHARKL